MGGASTAAAAWMAVIAHVVLLDIAGCRKAFCRGARTLVRCRCTAARADLPARTRPVHDYRNQSNRADFSA